MHQGATTKANAAVAYRTEADENEPKKDQVAGFSF